MTYKDFKTLFNSNFWKTLSSEVLSWHKSLTHKEKEKILKSCYEDIKVGIYKPAKLEMILLQGKGKFGFRKIPVFNAKDYCIYYYCVKSLEEELAINRVPNTYGGWSFGGAMRTMETEEEEERFLSAEAEYYESIDILGYNISGSLNPFAWSRYYGEFNNKIYQNIQLFQSREEENYVLSFDISNFYNSINLDILRFRIKEAIPSEKEGVMKFLFDFLHSWNSKLNTYGIESIGLPQDEMQDCSRILANFYLQTYDSTISNFCKTIGATYLRYSDDQLIFFNDRDKIEEIMFSVSNALEELNLSLNAQKTMLYSVEELLKIKGFELFEMISEENISTENLEFCIDSLYGEENIPFRQPLLYKILFKLDGYTVSTLHKEKFKELLLRNIDFVYKNPSIKKLDKVWEILSGTERTQLKSIIFSKAQTTYDTKLLYLIIKWGKLKNFNMEKYNKRFSEINKIMMP